MSNLLSDERALKLKLVNNPKLQPYGLLLAEKILIELQQIIATSTFRDDDIAHMAAQKLSAGLIQAINEWKNSVIDSIEIESIDNQNAKLTTHFKLNTVNLYSCNHLFVKKVKQHLKQNVSPMMQADSLNRFQKLINTICCFFQCGTPFPYKKTFFGNHKALKDDLSTLTHAIKKNRASW